MSHSLAEHVANIKLTTTGAVLTGSTTGAAGGFISFVSGMTLDDAVKMAAISASIAMFFYYTVMGIIAILKFAKKDAD